MQRALYGVPMMAMDQAKAMLLVGLLTDHIATHGSTCDVCAAFVRAIKRLIEIGEAQYDA